jgi:alkanesulfonate monooxygenase SsuD/methylene tetrahydromethanopterin reductase-like flavin-dependent oxidoreductase (luciferase family)
VLNNVFGGQAVAVKVKFGCYLPVPTTPVDKLLKIAVANEEAGFDLLMLPDHILFGGGIVPEAWSMLAAIATVTHKALLGTCVSDPHRYHPAVLAQKVATVDQISGGRAILGLGAGEAMNLDPFGIKWKRRPVAKLLEATMIMRRLWSGETLNFDGEFWKLRNAFLQIFPVRRKVPIYFGANAPRTLRLTGELADGLWSIPLPPRLFEKRLKIVKEGACKAGRSVEEIDAGIYLYSSIAKNREDAYKQIEAFKGRIITSPKILMEAGYNIELPEHVRSISFFEALRDLEVAEKIEMARFRDLIPREAAIDFSIAGTVDDCIEKINEYVKSGATSLLIMNIGPDPKWVLKVYSEEIIPHFR